MNQHFHVLRVRYHGHTNTQTSRISIQSDRFKQRIVFEYADDAGPTLDQAEAKLRALGFHVVGHGEGPAWDYVVCSTFQPLK